jgi:hypothetical protein
MGALVVKGVGLTWWLEAVTGLRPTGFSSLFLVAVGEAAVAPGRGREPDPPRSAPAPTHNPALGPEPKHPRADERGAPDRPHLRALVTGPKACRPRRSAARRAFSSNLPITQCDAVYDVVRCRPPDSMRREGLWRQACCTARQPDERASAAAGRLAPPGARVERAPGPHGPCPDLVVEYSFVYWLPRAGTGAVDAAAGGIADRRRWASARVGEERG